MALLERLMMLVRRLRDPKQPPDFVYQYDARLDEVDQRLASIRERDRRRVRLQLEYNGIRRRHDD